MFFSTHLADHALSDLALMETFSPTSVPMANIAVLPPSDQCERRTPATLSSAPDSLCSAAAASASAANVHSQTSSVKGRRISP